jgi:hypothetical protein
MASLAAANGPCRRRGGGDGEAWPRIDIRRLSNPPPPASQYRGAQHLIPLLHHGRQQDSVARGGLSVVAMRPEGDGAQQHRSSIHSVYAGCERHRLLIPDDSRSRALTRRGFRRPTQTLAARIPGHTHAHNTKNGPRSLLTMSAAGRPRRCQVCSVVRCGAVQRGAERWRRACRHAQAGTAKRCSLGHSTRLKPVS